MWGGRLTIACRCDCGVSPLRTPVVIDGRSYPNLVCFHRNDSDIFMRDSRQLGLERDEKWLS
jgi:hypothetical protein